MESLTLKQVLVIGAFGLVGWALCGAIMFIGMGVTSLQTTIYVHAVGAPIIFGTLAWIYFTRFGYTAPVTTAAIFVAIVIAVDFFLVALVINKSLDMFTGLLGTWIPFLLIFLSTYFVGRTVTAGTAQVRRA